MSPSVRFRHFVGTLRWRFIHLMGNRPIKSAEAEKWLAGIARYAHLASGDLSSLTAKESDAPGSQLRDYRERLGRLHREMAALEADVRDAAREIALKHRDRLPREKLKLNLGSSAQSIDGWVSLDQK